MAADNLNSTMTVLAQAAPRGEAINIGKIIFEGYCNNATFTVVDVDTNIVHTTKAADSIVDKYDVAATVNNRVTGPGHGIPSLRLKRLRKTLP